MGARRQPATEALLAALLQVLRAAYPKPLTSEEVAQGTLTTCQVTVHCARGTNHARCWVCEGTGLRHRHGWEVRRHIAMLADDHLVRKLPVQDGLVRWLYEPDADVEGYWDDLAAEADHHVGP